MKISRRALACLLAVATLYPDVGGAALPERSLDMRSRSVLDFRPLNVSLGCLSPLALRLLDRIETQFGSVEIVSTCRPGAVIAGTSRPSLHGSGNAIDFNAGSRKDQILVWLIANHQGGGTMTYPDMDHIHVDIGRHFVSLAGGRRSARNSSDRQTGPSYDEKMGIGAR